MTLILLCLLLGSCMGETGGEESYQVMLIVPDGVTVTSENPIMVEKGHSASFNVTIPYSHEFLRVSHGSYNPETGVVTVNNITENMRVTLYADKMMNSVYYYDVNAYDAFINTQSENMAENPYYTYEKYDRQLKVRVSTDVISVMNAASLFYEDTTFVREGYILKEYNTRPDGSGVSYSLGSKFPLNSEDKVLYCIWEKETPASDFKYEEIILEDPTGRVSNWARIGIRITEYLGDDETLVIPERIEGKYVTSIAKGAIKNKNIETLVMGRRILEIQDGAITGCTSLNTIYYPDSIYYISNDALDEASYSNLHNFYVNATMAPRYSDGDAAFAIKFARLISSTEKPRIIMLGGSSAYQGFSSAYLEALLDYEYSVINFGTTRTTQGFMYLEAFSALTDEDDVILYAPENSIYMMGESTLYWKTLRDLEGMYNIFRYIDIANYDNVLGAFAELNAGDPTAVDPNNSPRYTRKADRYEDVIKRTSIDMYGEYQHKDRQNYCSSKIYKDVYVVTLNERYKSTLEGNWQNMSPNDNWSDPNNKAWCNVTDPQYTVNLNRAITKARLSGARVYFSFCPVDVESLASGVLTATTWLTDYEEMITDTYYFDGILGSVSDYIYDHKYFYDNAFHLNDYGRTYRTYQVYLDLCNLFGIEDPVAIDAKGTTAFRGCLFE